MKGTIFVNLSPALPVTYILSAAEANLVGVRLQNILANWGSEVFVFKGGFDLEGGVQPAVSFDPPFTREPLIRRRI